MMFPLMLSLRPQNIICSHVMNGKCSLSHSSFSFRLCGNSVAEDTINTLYFSFRYFNPSMLPGIRGAVLKKPLLLTCFSKEGKASSSVFPYMFSMFSLIPESLCSKMINWAYTSANTPSMSTKICCLILLSFINN